MRHDRCFRPFSNFPNNAELPKTRQEDAKLFRTSKHYHEDDP